MQSTKKHRCCGAFGLFSVCGLRFAVAAEDVHDFVFDNRADCVSGGSQILTGVKVGRIESKVFSDGCRDCKTKVAVDVDFADCHACGFAEHFFGNTLCAGHISAVLVDDFHVFLRNAGRSVQNDGESGQAFADFFENVETEFGLAFEFECAVRGADCDCEGINARLFDEFLNLVGVGVARVFGVDFDCVFNACEFAEFCFDDDAVVVCVFDNLFGDADVFGEGVRACVNHNGSETAVNTVFAECEAVAVVKVQSNGQTAGFDCCFDHFLR